MPFDPKDWVSEADHAGPPASPPGTPISGASLEDVEIRVTDYVDCKTTISVTEPPYNATGDGTTDDTAAIQAAIDACGAAGGGAVFFPPATYLVTSLDLVSNMTLYGPGATLQQDTGQTLPILYFAQTVNNPIQDADLLTNVTIRDLAFLGDTTVAAEATRCGIWIGQGTDIRVENCRFTDCYSSAVCCQNCLRVWYIDNYATNCGLGGTGVGRNVFDLYGGGAFSDMVARTGVLVATGNTVVNTTTGGIIATSAGDGTTLEFRAVITDNYLQDCDWVGIAVESGAGSRANVITGNRIQDCYVGVQMSDNSLEHGASVLIERNVIANNHITSTVTGSYGIQLTGARKTCVSSNVIRSKGPRIYGYLNATTNVRCADLVVDGNVLENANTVNSNLANGLQIWSTDGAVISGNRIVNTASNYGYDDITLADSTDVVVVNNSSYLSPRRGIYVEDGDDVLIADNSILNVADAGIITTGTTNTNVSIRGNHIIDNRGGSAVMWAGVSVGGTTCTRVTVENNTIVGTAVPVYNLATKPARANDNFTDESSSVASGATISIPLGHDVITVTGTDAITTVNTQSLERRVTLIFSGTAAGNGLTDGGNLKLAGNLAYTPNDTITLVSDGTNWYEVARSSPGA